MLPLLAAFVLVLGWHLLWKLEVAGRQSFTTWQWYVVNRLRPPLFMLSGAILGIEHLLVRPAAGRRLRLRLDVPRLIAALPLGYLAFGDVLAYWGLAPSLYQWVLLRVFGGFLQPVNSVAAGLFGHLLVRCLQREPVAREDAAQDGEPHIY